MKKQRKILSVAFVLALGAGMVSATVIGTGKASILNATDAIETSPDKIMNFENADWNLKCVALKFNPELADMSVWAATGADITRNKYFTQTDKYGVVTNADGGGIYNFGTYVFWSYGNVNQYGNIVTVPDDYTVASAHSGKTYHSTTGKSFICKLADGAMGDWETFIAPTSLTLPEATKSVEAGDTYTIKPALVTEDTNPLIFYKSSDTNIATVDDKGVVTAVAAGTATISVYSGLLKQDLALTVVEGKVVKSVQITNENKTIHSYVGNNWKLTPITAKRVFADDTESALTVTDDMLSGTVDTTKAGSYTVTLTYRTFTDTLTVVVDELPAIEMTTGTFGKDSTGWGNLLFFTDAADDISQYVNLTAELYNEVASHMLVNGTPIVLKGIKGLGGARYVLYTDYVPKAGDTMEITAGLKLYHYSGTSDGNHAPKGDGEFFAVKETKKAKKWVCTNSPAAANQSEWVDFVAAPTGITLSANKSFVSVGEAMQLTSVIAPEGSYASLTWSSSDETIATVGATGIVSGVKEGTCTITAKSGELSGTFELNVTAAKAIKGFKFVGAHNYYAFLVGADVTGWKPVLTSAKYVFEDDTESGEIAITSDEYTIDAFSTSEAAELAVKATLTLGGNSYEGSIAVKVSAPIDEAVKKVAIVDWFDYSTFIQSSTVLNKANLTTAEVSASYNKHISYTRKDGTAVGINTFYQLGSNIALFPSFLYGADGNKVINATNYNTEGFYEVGDRITIGQNTPVFQWTGDVFDLGGKGLPVEGTGDIFVEGYYKEEQTYRYSATGWSLYKTTTELVAAKDTIDIKIGKNVLSGITRGPDGATSGVITYASSDEGVATVNKTTGVISGIKEGTATITATWTDDDSDKTFSKNITVNVHDYAASISFEGPVSVKKGSDLDMSALKGSLVYKSGKKVAITDYKDYTITGFDKNAVGTQNVTFTATIDGEKVKGTLVVNVIDDTTTSSSTPSTSTPTTSGGTGSSQGSGSSGGCGGAIVGTSIVSVIALVGVIALASKRKKEEK